MLKNYLITALNNLIKNKLYTFINITGLAIGLAACIVISLYVADQFSYDKQWKDSGRIYRINTVGNIPGMEQVKLAATAIPVMPALEEYFEGKIEQSTRIYYSHSTISKDTEQFHEDLWLVDPDFIEMFQLRLLSGSLEAVLESPGKTALRADIAARLFGDRNPLGQTINATINGLKSDYLVTAVYQVPGNSVLDIPMISLLRSESLPSMLRSWNNANTITYFKLKNGIDIDSLKPLIPPFLDRNMDISKVLSDPDITTSDILSLEFQNIEDIHLNTPWDTYRAGGNRSVVISFAAIAVLVLLIACINFTILTTAKATQRAKEVAVRKVAGAKRKQLIIQFLGESLLLTLFALLLSLGIVEIMLPLFQSIVSKPISMNYTFSVILPLLALFIIVGLSGGLYPAFILSGFRPGTILKANRSKETRASISFRNILVIFQFCISSILIISTIAIYIQLKHSLNLDPGFNRENLLVINNPDLGFAFKDKIALLKTELKNQANITDVCLSEIQPSQKVINNRVYTLPGAEKVNHIIYSGYICYDYFTTYQIPVIAGRNYSEELDLPDQLLDMMTYQIGDGPTLPLSERNIVINKSASRELGFLRPEDAIGKTVNTTTANNSRYTIIGVVADNHLFSINALPRAEIYLLQPEYSGVITVRFKGAPKAAVDRVKSVWKKVMGEAEISTVFVNQLLAKEFEQEETEVRVIISFALLAVLIACMGLFGSASFTVERRTKEIGLRKVMGAKVRNIAGLLLWQFSKPVLVANIIAWPVAVFVMHNWLQHFPYKFNQLFMIPICLVSCLLALSIAWLTVAGNTTRMAKSKPIKALRYE